MSRLWALPAGHLGWESANPGFGVASGPDVRGPEASPLLPGAGTDRQGSGLTRSCTGGDLEEEECTHPREGAEVGSPES